jgi:hypothetical protein
MKPGDKKLFLQNYKGERHERSTGKIGDYLHF